MWKFFAPLWSAAHQLIFSHFQFTEGISVASVVDRRNCITDKMSRFTMPMFKMVMEHGVHVFKVHEEAELTTVLDEELHRLVTAASAAKRSAVVWFFPWLRLPLTCGRVGSALLFLWLACATFCCPFDLPSPGEARLFRLGLMFFFARLFPPLVAGLRQPCGQGVFSALTASSRATVFFVRPTPSITTLTFNAS